MLQSSFGAAANEKCASHPSQQLHTVLFFFLLISFPLCSKAQEQDVKKLKALSIEDLMNLEVTSVSKGAERLSEVASAIQVITSEDILRSGATNVPEALRLAPNLQVAQLNSSSWIISARGFNTVFANKLLVLIDGRTVYTPLFGGVVWELQSVLLEDIERIEVISGPGGTLWGANAVNGVINIITKKARDTQGLYVSAAAGNFLKRSFAARYGDNIGENAFFRVYAQHSERDSTLLPDGKPNADAWRSSQAGFRTGLQLNSKDFVSVQGDVMIGERKTSPTITKFDTQNLLARWTHTIKERSDLSLQVYFDRYWLGDPITTADELTTYDIDFQHRIPAGKNQSILWGAGYRMVNDKVINRNPFVGLLPEKKSMPLYSGFIQYEVDVWEQLKVTVGTKFLNNIYSGFEFQPSARVAWTTDHVTTWAAATRAVRAPSRFDVDYYLPLTPQPPTVPSVAGGPDFDSEKLHAYELGFRVRPNALASLSLAGFYNEYKHVYSVEPLEGTFTYQIQNGSEAESWGAEFSGFYQVIKAWRLRGGFTYFAKDLRAKPGRNHDPSYLANDAKHHFMLQSMTNLPYNFKFDLVARYMDYLPATFATVRVPEYVTFDARVAWEFKSFEFAIVGQNLWSDSHSEFGAIKIERSVYGKVSCRL